MATAGFSFAIGRTGSNILSLVATCRIRLVITSATCFLAAGGPGLVITSGICFGATGGVSFVLTWPDVAFVMTSGASMVITWVESICIACWRAARASWGIG